MLSKTLVTFSRRKLDVDLFWGAEQWFCLYMFVFLFFAKNMVLLMNLFALEMSEQRSVMK